MARKGVDEMTVFGSFASIFDVGAEVRKHALARCTIEHVGENIETTPSPASSVSNSTARAERARRLGYNGAI
jgi:hypothetical protein